MTVPNLTSCFWKLWNINYRKTYRIINNSYSELSLFLYLIKRRNPWMKAYLFRLCPAGSRKGGQSRVEGSGGIWFDSAGLSRSCRQGVEERFCVSLLRLSSAFTSSFCWIPAFVLICHQFDVKVFLFSSGKPESLHDGDTWSISPELLDTRISEDSGVTEGAGIKHLNCTKVQVGDVRWWKYKHSSALWGKCFIMLFITYRSRL